MTKVSALLERVREAARGRGRLLLTAGLALSLMLGGTYAIWQESVTATTGEFKAGTVEIGLGPSAVEEYTMTFGGDKLWPQPGNYAGDPASIKTTISQEIEVHNTGSLPFTFTTPRTVTGTWFVVEVTDEEGQPISPTDPVELQADHSTNLEVTATFNASALTGAIASNVREDAFDDLGTGFQTGPQGALQGASGSVTIAFTAKNT